MRSLDRRGNLVSEKRILHLEAFGGTWSLQFYSSEKWKYWLGREEKSKPLGGGDGQDSQRKNSVVTWKLPWLKMKQAVLPR